MSKPNITKTLKAINEFCPKMTKGELKAVMDRIQNTYNIELVKEDRIDWFCPKCYKQGHYIKIQ